jgi:hypothetical protein
MVMIPSAALAARSAWSVGLSEWAVAFAADSVVADILRQQVLIVDDTDQRQN